MSDTSPQKPTLLRRLTVVGLLCTAGGSGGLLLVPEPAARAAQPVEVVLAGDALPSGPLAGRAVAEVDAYLAAPIALSVGDKTLRMRRADVGARVDRSHLLALLQAADDPQSPLRKVHQAVLPQQQLALPMPVVLDAAVATRWLLQLKDEIDREPIEAHIDARKREALPAKPGLALDVYGSLERIEGALARGAQNVQLSALETQPRTRNQRLQDVSLAAVLGDFTTRYNRTTDAADRTHNLHVAAAKIDGYVLGPGELFDFNAVVGDRTAHNGFRRAPVIADGELVDGVGGGTCQIASTLHAAVFFAGLPVLTRSPHSHPSYYIKLGLDAAVAYGSLNFRFQNDQPFPIVIEATVDDGFVHVALHGKQRDNRVTFLRRVDGTVPFEEKLVEDESLPKGTRLLQQRGIPGFSITRFRVVLDERTGVARRERATDSYPPTTQIWRVGSGPEAPAGYEPPRNDGHPEYLADEVMSAVQGPSTQGIEVNTTPGRTGTPGWIERDKLLHAPAQGGSAQAAPAVIPGAPSGA